MERILGPKHMLMFETLSNLGYLYVEQGKLIEAEQIYQRVLQGRMETTDSDDLSKTLFLLNLGCLYVQQGQPLLAERMFKQAVQSNEKGLAPEHISTIGTLLHLGYHYASQDKLVEAEQIYQRALQGFLKTCGPKHVLTLRTTYGLGQLYHKQEKRVMAAQMFNQALHGYQEALGAEHALTLATVDALTAVLRDSCYAAAQLTARSAVLVIVKQLAQICLKFPIGPLLGRIGRAFVWVGDDKMVTAAFAYQSALGYCAICDGCDVDLNVETGRLICTVCKDIDLCRSCFDKLELFELEDGPACDGHAFFDTEPTTSLGSSTT